MGDTGDSGADDEWVRVAAAGVVGPGVIVDAEPGACAQLGDDYVVWRSFDGRPCVMEARCPHNWSHLGAEGAVDGDEIVCTSHFWRFTAEGTGTKLNVNGRRDAKADIAVLPCLERDGAIWARRPRA